MLSRWTREERVSAVIGSTARLLDVLAQASLASLRCTRRKHTGVGLPLYGGVGLARS